MANSECLPYFVEGEVVKGFGRGSKELGVPTANFPDVVRDIPASLKCGVYCGWASVDEGPVLGMVMSIGWNPYYNNTMKTMETHILHKFEEDFYGSRLKVIILGYIRPMENYSSLDALIEAISNDIAISKEKLLAPDMEEFKQNNFFSSHGSYQSGCSSGSSIFANVADASCKKVRTVLSPFKW